MKNLIIFLLLLPLLFLFSSCEKEEKGPFDPNSLWPTVSCEINNYKFKAQEFTIGGSYSNSNSLVGIFANDSMYYISIQIPNKCGRKIFLFPNSEPNVGLLLNNTNCTNGKLIIKEYNYNYIEGEFEFTTHKDSLINIRKGKFSFIYRVN